MSDDGGSGPPIAPPTTPGAIRTEPRVRWPAILGSLCIAQGSINFVFALIVSIMMLRVDADVFDVVMGAVLLLIFAGGIATGVALLFRRRWSLPLAWGWSAAILIILILLAIGILIDAAAANGEITGLVFYAVVAVWLGTLPVAVLLTTLRRRNRRQIALAS